jgi:DNA polymerase (family 10)
LFRQKILLAVIDYFTGLPDILSVNAKGDTKASVIVQGGIQADLRVVSDAEFPFALAYFTGSKEHNIVMRQRAIERGLRPQRVWAVQIEGRDARSKPAGALQNGGGDLSASRTLIYSSRTEGRHG